MYVSHAVRSIRDDPIEGEEVSLLLEAAEGTTVDDLAEVVRGIGGTVEAEREFQTLQIRVAHEQVADVCALEGVEAIETATTLEIDPDGAGEDVRPDAGGRSDDGV